MGRNYHPKADLYIAERDAGLTYREIAEKHGISYQAVAQTCARYSVGHFRAYTKNDVVYPNLRKWLNDNKVTKSEFIRRMGNVYSGNLMAQVGNWFSGKTCPMKQSIDKILEITGLTYEQLFATEDDSDGR